MKLLKWIMVKIDPISILEIEKAYCCPYCNHDTDSSHGIRVHLDYYHRLSLPVVNMVMEELKNE